MSLSQVTHKSFPDQLRDTFKTLKTREDVANLLDVSDKGLRHLLYGAAFRASLYYTFEIPKKSGGIRKITSPIARLKTLQRRLLKILTAVYTPKNSAHGFVKARSICTNAKIHVRRRHILNIDLEDFFPSINFGRVRGIFLAEPYNCTRDIATVLAQICCYKNELPQGAPTSPIVSNMICVRLDSHLIRLAATHHCSYSRYADDITISSNKRIFPVEIAETINFNGKVKCKLGKSVLKTIKNNGFQINADKVRLQRNNERQVVTGLVANKKVNVPREFVRDVRAMLRNWKTKGIAACQKDFETRYLVSTSPHSKTKLFKEMVRGKIDFIGTVRGKDDALYLKLLQQLADSDKSLLSNKTLNKLKQLNDRYSHVLDSLWVIDATTADDSNCQQGTGFYLKDYGVITCTHVLMQDETCLVEVYRRDATERQFAKIEVMDTELDLAVLTLKETPEVIFEISQKEIKQGEQIWLAGFPHFGPGHTGVVEPGYVIGTKEDVNHNPRILISASIVSGNSGGPVFDEDWNIIGVAAKGIESQNQLEEKNFYEVIPIKSLINIK